jgi:hypothetical protein
MQWQHVKFKILEQCNEYFSHLSTLHSVLTVLTTMNCFNLVLDQISLEYNMDSTIFNLLYI